MGGLLGQSQKADLIVHPRAADASLEKLRALSGVIRVRGPVPRSSFLLEDDEPASGQRASN